MDMAKMPWLKLHTEVIRDLKLMRCSPGEKWVWVTLLCLAAESSERGKIFVTPTKGLEYSEIATIAGFHLNDDFFDCVEPALKYFAAVNMISIDKNGVIDIIHFTERQYDNPSDHPAEVAKRVKKHRENLLKRECNERDTESDTESDTEKKPSSEVSETVKQAEAIWREGYKQATGIEPPKAKGYEYVNLTRLVKERKCEVPSVIAFIVGGEFFKANPASLGKLIAPAWYTKALADMNKPTALMKPPRPDPATCTPEQAYQYQNQMRKDGRHKEVPSDVWDALTKKAREMKRLP